MTAAMATLQQLTISPRHRFMPDDVSYVDMPVKALQGHRQWTDAYLLRLARAHGVTFATFDGAVATLDRADASAVYVLI